MEIIVLGMHRSGTSALTRIINMMGAYFGDESDSTGANEENPKGFWERKDIRQLNDLILHSVDCDWDIVSKYSVNNIEQSKLAAFDAGVLQILSSLNRYRSWVIKEPRLCLILDLWRRHLSNPTIVFIYRNPLEVAHSLLTRNNIPIRVGLALWDYYCRQALHLTKGMNFVLVSHNRLMVNPHEEVASIFNSLDSLESGALTLPSDDKISEFIDIDFYRERYETTDLKELLDPSTIELFNHLNKNDGGIKLDLIDLEISNNNREYLELYERLRACNKELTLVESDFKASKQIWVSESAKREKSWESELESQKKDWQAKVEVKDKVWQSRLDDLEAQLKISKRELATQNEGLVKFENEISSLNLSLSSYDSLVQRVNLDVLALRAKEQWFKKSILRRLRRKFTLIPNQTNAELEQLIKSIDLLAGCSKD